MSEEDPNVILSAKSCTVIEGDLAVEVHIFRLEGSDEWTLEVIDEDNALSYGTMLFKVMRRLGRHLETSDSIIHPTPAGALLAIPGHLRQIVSDREAPLAATLRTWQQIRP